MGKRAALLFGRMEVAAELEDGFNHWYNTEYMLQRLTLPGWLTGRRFEAVEGSPKYGTIYDLESVDVFKNPDYWRLRERLEGTPRGRLYYNAFQNPSRSIYEQIYPDPPRLAVIEAPAMLAVLVDPLPEVEDEYNAWCSEELTPCLEAVPGVLLARRFVAVEGGPKYAHLYDLVSLDAPASKGWEIAGQSSWGERLAPKLRITRFLGRRIYP